MVVGMTRESMKERMLRWWCFKKGWETSCMSFGEKMEAGEGINSTTLRRVCWRAQRTDVVFRGERDCRSLHANHLGSGVPGKNTAKGTPVSFEPIPLSTTHYKTQFFSLLLPTSLSHTQSTYVNTRAEVPRATKTTPPLYHTLSAFITPQDISPSSAGGSRLTGMARVCASAANKAALDCSSRASSRSTAPMSFAAPPSTEQTRHDAALVGLPRPPPSPPRGIGACRGSNTKPGKERRIATKVIDRCPKGLIEEGFGMECALV